MDNQIKKNPLLALLDHPAFLVKDEIIVQVNSAAQEKNISVGQNISNYLGTASGMYLDGGWECLYLRLQLPGGWVGTTVTAADDMHLFCLDLPDDSSEDGALYFLPQIASHLRRPLHDLFCAEEARIHDPVMRRDLHRLHRIIANMADVPRFRERSSLLLEDTDLFWFFSESVEKASALLEKTNIRLEFSALPQCIYGAVDRELLERAVYNLIANAAKFSPENGVIQIRLTLHGNRLHFTIQDQGPGIDSSVLANIFRRYRRSPAIEDGRCGAGFGMAVVKAAADVHCGTILIDRPDSGGTRITLAISAREGTVLLRSPIMVPKRVNSVDLALLELSEILPPSVF